MLQAIIVESARLGRRTHCKRWLGLAIAAALLGSWVPSFAQQASTGELEEVLVTAT